MFYLLPHRFRWLLLLGASCFFYMFFKPEYILIMAFIVLVDYAAGRLMENADGKVRKYYLMGSLVANIGLLAVFKYYNVINDDITGVCALLGYHNTLPYLKMLLPIGLSFHTFQAMSYTIEVYKGRQRAEKHLGIYALYVMFYPQLVAGPIERPANMLPQFHEKKVFEYDNVVQGLRLMLLGFFKKIVLADRLALYTDAAYNDPASKGSVAIVAALVLFAFQIYYDFSGYNDIALGAARVMGYKLMDNFNYPFISKNVSEFWRRWHISLSTWFRDYVFYPLVKATRNWGKYSIAIGLFVTFFLGGIWHNASWNFIIFGVLEGLVLVYEFLSKPYRVAISQKMPAWLYDTSSQVLTFIFLIVSWTFFKAKDLPEALIVIKKVPGFFGEAGYFILHANANTLVTNMVSVINTDGTIKSIYTLGDIFVLLALVIAAQSISYFERVYGLKERLDQMPLFVRWGIYYVVIAAIVVYGSFEGRQFIYFQF